MKEVRVLGEHFSDVLEKQGCNTTELEREWLKLKLDLDRNHRGENFHTLWKRVLKEKTHKYPNIMHLVHIVLVLLVATSQVERQFSTIKRILGDWRLKLGPKTVETLLRICSEGPEHSKFDPKSSVALWHAKSVGMRRPNNTPIK